RRRARRRRRPRRARLPRRRLRRGRGRRRAPDGSAPPPPPRARQGRGPAPDRQGRGLVEKARPLYEELRRTVPAEYDDSASIGKRYRRQDEIGTPWALTIDHQTLDDGTIT